MKSKRSYQCDNTNKCARCCAAEDSNYDPRRTGDATSQPTNVGCYMYIYLVWNGSRWTAAVDGEERRGKRKKIKTLNAVKIKSLHKCSDSRENYFHLCCETWGGKGGSGARRRRHRRVDWWNNQPTNKHTWPSHTHTHRTLDQQPRLAHSVTNIDNVQQTQNQRRSQSI